MNKVDFDEQAASNYFYDDDCNTVGEMLTILRESDPGEIHVEGVCYYEPFTYYTADRLLAEIDGLSSQFEEIYNKGRGEMLSNIKNILSYDDKDEDEKLDEIRDYEIK